MVESVITLAIALTGLYVVYMVINWILGEVNAPAVASKIIYIVFAVVGVVILLRFVVSAFGGMLNL